MSEIDEPQRGQRMRNFQSVEREHSIRVPTTSLMKKYAPMSFHFWSMLRRPIMFLKAASIWRHGGVKTPLTMTVLNDGASAIRAKRRGETG
jgi:hypothetical protein